MRIIGGAFRGRLLSAPKGFNTRPTQERVRESIFNVLTNIGLRETKVLDLYAGTGAFSLEALSRGAAKAVAVDSRTARWIRKNAESCGVSSRLEIFSCDVAQALKQLSGKNGEGFDYVFIDPPYRRDLVPATLEKLIKYSLLAAGAYILVEHAVGEAWEPCPLYCFERQKRYGDTMVTYLVYKGKEAEEE